MHPLPMVSSLNVQCAGGHQKDQLLLEEIHDYSGLSRTVFPLVSLIFSAQTIALPLAIPANLIAFLSLVSRRSMLDIDLVDANHIERKCKRHQ